MHFCHSPQIWEQFPQLVPGVLIADGIQPEIDVEYLQEPFFQRARQRLSQSPESQMPEIAAWRRAYTKMGLKPTKYRSASEALLRRFKREDTLPKLHPLVDLCNAVSLAFALPVAVFDLDHIDSYLEVRHATGTEAYLSFSGAVENPAPQEVIFADGENQVHARRWTFRQSRQSTVSAGTARVLIVSEGLHDTAPVDVPALIETLTGKISAVWSAPYQPLILTANQPLLEIS